jgi:hypothetical protein
MYPMEKNQTKQRSLVDKIFKDKEGKVVLWQVPNAPLLLWAFSEVLNEFVAHGSFKTLCMAVAFGALFTWAWLEMTTGVNYARRALGVIVLVLTIYGKVK